MRNVKVEWDATEKQIKDNKLPNIVLIPNSVRFSGVANHLSDEYGFTVLDWKTHRSKGVSPTKHVLRRLVPNQKLDGQNKDGKFNFQTLGQQQIQKLRQEDQAFGDQTTERIDFRLEYRRDDLKKKINKKARALYNTKTKTKTIDQIWKMISDLGENDRFETPLKSNLTYQYIPAILKHPNTSLELRNHLLDHILQVFKQDFLRKFGKSDNPIHYETSERYLAPYNTHIWAESQFTRKMIDKILDFVLVDYPKFVDKTFQANPELADIFFRSTLLVGTSDEKKSDLKSRLYLNILPALIQNERVTGAQLKRIQPHGLMDIIELNQDWRKPILVALAKNRKLPKEIRDELMKFGVERHFWEHLLAVDSMCRPESLMAIKNAIRMALAQNPSLPKKDLLLLAQDPCVSVAVVAQGMLKRRF